MSVCEEMQELEHLCTVRENVTLYSQLWKPVWQFLKVKTKLLHDPKSIPKYISKQIKGADSDTIFSFLVLGFLFMGFLFVCLFF